MRVRGVREDGIEGEREKEGWDRIEGEREKKK